jgi:hypothetical protein
MNEPTYYPEHDKLSAIREESQTIGEFLDTCGYALCEYQESPILSDYDEYLPVRGSIQDILAHYFCIDQNKIEAEKRAMLGDLRKANA